MNGKRLPEKEIEKRLLRLTNLERLRQEQKLRNDRLSLENRQLKARIVDLEAIVLSQQKIIETLQLQVEELRGMVFGKKKKKKDNDTDDDKTFPMRQRECLPREKTSYQRPIPKEEDVTETKEHPIQRCAHCQTTLADKKEVAFFVEDIPIPVARTVEKHVVERGYCTVCKKWMSAIPLPSNRVILGKNIQKYANYLSVLCRISFSQIRNLLFDTYTIRISEGEIAKLLEREAIRLKLEYERQKERIRSEPGVHADETSWKLFLGDGYKSYAWALIGAISHEPLFLVGENRGNGNLEKLIGKDYRGFVVSDDYAVYHRLPYHQLCFAHLIRKFRDLAYSKELEEEIRLSCLKQYEKLCELFYDLQKRDGSLQESYVSRLKELSVIHALDPQKLVRVKTTLAKNISKYLAFLKDSRIPHANNEAERAIRPLVIKRKISFGSMCKRTAENLAATMSVMVSLKQRNPDNFLTVFMGV